MNGNRATVVQILIQGGAIGITLFVIWLWAGFNSDYVERSIEVQTQLVNNTEQQTEAIEELVDVVRDWRRISAPNVTLRND